MPKKTHTHFLNLQLSLIIRPFLYIRELRNFRNLRLIQTFLPP